MESLPPSKFKILYQKRYVFSPHQSRIVVNLCNCVTPLCRKRSNFLRTCIASPRDFFSNFTIFGANNNFDRIFLTKFGKIPCFVNCTPYHRSSRGEYLGVIILKESATLRNCFQLGWYFEILNQIISEQFSSGNTLKKKATIDQFQTNATSGLLKLSEGVKENTALKQFN